MSSYNPRLLLPPEEEEIYPYRRVWRSTAVEVSLLLVITLILFVIVNLLGIPIPQTFHRPVGFLLALMPLGFWLLFSWFSERSVPEPRQRLLVVALVSGLVANAIGIPLIDEFFQVDRWLPLSTAPARIIGYTFTVGIVQETLKYLVIRYIVWPEFFRTRSDALAYGFASAIGYATVLNLQFVFSHTTLLDVTAIHIFNTTALHLAGSAILGYGMAEVSFGRPTPLLLMITLAVASTIVGVVIPIRTGLVNASLSLEVSTASPIRGLALSLVMIVAIGIAVGFLMENAERQEREVTAGRER